MRERRHRGVHFMAEQDEEGDGLAPLPLGRVPALPAGPAAGPPGGRSPFDTPAAAAAPGADGSGAEQQAQRSSSSVPAMARSGEVQPQAPQALPPAAVAPVVGSPLLPAVLASHAGSAAAPVGTLSLPDLGALERQQQHAQEHERAHQRYRRA